MAWVVAEDFATACDEWPEFREDWGGLEHAAYCLGIERKLAEMRSAGLAVEAVAPIRFSEYLPWAADRGEDPSASVTRSGYAADRLRLGHVRPWPPHRNDPCWCGSGRKYKRCCAAPDAPYSDVGA
jgi:hypothetical protein